VSPQKMDKDTRGRRKIEETMRKRNKFWNHVFALVPNPTLPLTTESAIGFSPRRMSPSLNGSSLSSSRNRNAFLKVTGVASIGAAQCAGIICSKSQSPTTRSTKLFTRSGSLV
jgi:hypothetical protein